jgi:hypothetical protein
LLNQLEQSVDPTLRLGAGASRLSQLLATVAIGLRRPRNVGFENHLKAFRGEQAISQVFQDHAVEGGIDMLRPAQVVLPFYAAPAQV